jgi:hypothetical protein
MNILLSMPADHNTALNCYCLKLKTYDHALVQFFSFETESCFHTSHITIRQAVKLSENRIIILYIIL